ncbi:MAG: Uma2 family endonuclease [Geminicoccaceae bacterium]
MADQAHRLMTVDEFLAWDDGTDRRYELADGVVMAMAPPSGPHRIIVVNASATVHNALGNRPPCRGEAEAGLRIDAHTMWQADLAVTCQPAAREIADPSLVIEVLSPTTRMQDLGRKLVDYKTVPTVTEIWMVDSERRWVQHWRRDQSGWLGQDFVGNASFESLVLQVRVALDQLYANSGL